MAEESLAKHPRISHIKIQRIGSKRSAGRPTKESIIQNEPKDSKPSPEVPEAPQEPVSEENIEKDTMNLLLRHAPPAIRHKLERPSVTTKLNPLVSSFLQAVLKECIQAILLLRDLHGIPHDAELDLQDIPYDEKYAVSYFSEHQLYSATGTLWVRKYKKEFSYILKILELVMTNLMRDHYFGILMRLLNYYELGVQEENTLLSARDFNMKEIHKLRKLLKSERRLLTKEIQEVTEHLGNLKDELHDHVVLYRVKIPFVCRWEAARQEQNNLKLGAAEKKYRKEVKTNGRETARETRVHNEMMQFLEISKNEFEEDIENWMEKHEKDLDELELKTHTTRMNIEIQRELTRELSELYEERTEAIAQWNEYKMRKKQMEEELEMQTKAAIKIQAWWRGVMYRKGLGPYRKKRRRKKSSGKKGKSPRNSARRK